MAFRALLNIAVRCNASNICRRTTTSLLDTRGSLLYPNHPLVTERARVISFRGYASKKKGAFIYTKHNCNSGNLTAKTKGALKLSSLDENEAVDVEGVKQGMENILSGLRQSLTKLSVKVTPGEQLGSCDIT